jgi:hypothetical protein
MLCPNKFTLLFKLLAVFCLGGLLHGLVDLTRRGIRTERSSEQKERKKKTKKKKINKKKKKKKEKKHFCNNKNI